jgi:2-polyprenyl-3-methyl-5-hydroxy-6-metoxy-1,4-benzoquinol methylase
MTFKENDIRPIDLMKAKEALLEEDKEFLRSRKSEFVAVGCPACGSQGASPWGEKEGFEYSICKNCGTVFMNPRASQDLMHRFYSQSKNYDFWNKYIFPASENVRREKIFKPRARRVVDYCTRFSIEGGTLLEVGAAFGTFCEAIRELDFFRRIIAVEPTHALAETCRQRGFETIEAPVESLTLDKGSVDVVVNFEVIEHLFDPASFVAACAKYLRPGGLFICACPNINALGTLVLKEKAKVIDHEHVNYFNPAALSLLFKKAGLEVIEVSTPGELDAELLKNALLENVNLQEQQPFFSRLLLGGNESILEDFQSIVKKSNLSSHMWSVGRKI